MADNLPKPRRWFRFSLRTMFVVVTVFCVWLGYQLNWIRQRREFLTTVSQRYFIVRPKGYVERWAPRGLWLLAERGVSKMTIASSDEIKGQPHEEFSAALVKAKGLFPESTIVAVGAIRGRATSWYISETSD